MRQGTLLCCKRPNTWLSPRFLWGIFGKFIEIMNMCRPKFGILSTVVVNRMASWLLLLYQSLFRLFFSVLRFVVFFLFGFFNIIFFLVQLKVNFISKYCCVYWTWRGSFCKTFFPILYLRRAIVCFSRSVTLVCFGFSLWYCGRLTRVASD